MSLKKEIKFLWETFQKGDVYSSEKLSKLILSKEPNNLISLKILAFSLKKQKNINDALIIQTKITNLVPNESEAHYNMANTLMELGRFEEAEKIFLKAIKLKPDFALAHNNLGNVLQELGRLDGAENSYKKAIEINPKYAESFNNLGNIFKKSNRIEEAIKYLKMAIFLEPNFFQAHSNLGVILKDLGKLSEAEASYNRALELNPKHNPSLLNRGKLFFAQKKFSLALKDFDACNTQDGRARALEALYAMGEIEDIYRRIEILYKSDTVNIRVAAFSAFLGEQKKRQTSNNFCPNPLNFLYVSNLSKHVFDINIFMEAVINDLLKINTVWEPLNKSTHGGYQSRNNLFDFSYESINTLSLLIKKEINTFYSKYKNSNCLFMQNWPVNQNIHGWYVVLKKQGFQSSHIHPSGWLSGVVYLKVVPSMDRNEGAIEFSLNGVNYSDINSSNIIHQPSVGSIILFPSSLHHKTIPFNSNQDRIIVAFDLLPLSKEAL